MKATTDMKKNRTGMSTAPELGQEMIDGAQEWGSDMPSGADGIKRIHRSYLEESTPLGTVPPPASVKGVAKSSVQKLKGNKPAVLLDKLGERLAFERSGTRIYEALIDKYDAHGGWEGGPTREELVHFHDEELEHFHIVKDAIESLGADPTALTPSADVAGVVSEGVLKIATDPRVSLGESLEALLTAELVDNDAWSMLISLAQAMGQDELGESFRDAMMEESEHLDSVRRWLTGHLTGEGRGRLHS